MSFINKRVIAASFMGNALEFYDFTLFGALSPIVAQEFFPSDEPYISLIKTFAIFAIGFFVRPLGALYFGHIGDTRGRKAALSLSIVLITFPTIIFGLLPTYNQIGFWAPLLLMLSRMMQGFCTGGEYNGAAIFALEHTPDNRQGFVSSLSFASCLLGALFATLVAWTFTKSSLFGFALPHWTWRIPVLMGALISFIGFYIRRELAETPEFSIYETRKKELLRKTPPKTLLQMVSEVPKNFSLSIILGAINGLVMYILFGYVLAFLEKFKGLSLNSAQVYTAFGLIVCFAASFVPGYLMDNGVAPWRQFKGASLFLLAIIFPVFYSLEEASHSSIMFALALLGVSGAFIGATQHLMLYKMFPINFRYRGISLGFSIGMSLVGGSSSYILTKLCKTAYSSNNPFIQSLPKYLLPAVWPLSISIICIPLIYVLLKYRAAELENQQKESVELKDDSQENQRLG